MHVVGAEGSQSSGGAVGSGAPDASAARLPLVPSPYRRRLDGGRSSAQSTVSLVVHATAWLLAALWFIVELAQETSDRTVPATLLIGSPFVVVAPALVAIWEGKFRQFEAEIRADNSLPEDAWDHVHEAVARVAALRLPILAVPVVLISVAYVAGDDFFADRLNLPQSGVQFVVGLLILQLGSVAAGWGVLGAVLTIVVAAASTRHRADFAPYAGTPSRASRALGAFCFSTAFMYGVAGALLMPGLCAAIWAADGLARLALVGTVSMVLVVTAALLGVPAVLLSRRSEDDRAAYLDRLSRQIDELGRAASDPSIQFGDTEYVRLRALLEMRSHVVGHSVENSSVQMVKRIPVAVLLPTSSVVASWLSLVAS